MARGKAAQPETQALADRAVATKERALGPQHPDLAQSLNNLAWIRMDAGDSAGARPVYERALAIHEKASGPHHLNEALRDRFEQHYFQCKDCFDRLQAVRALRAELIAAAPAFLLNNDVAAARREFKRTIELEGELEGEARHILSELETVSRPPR